MVVEDQTELIRQLSQPRVYGPGAVVAGGVERIDTHSSVVFLAGRDAYKLKRAVRYDYLDYSTASRRERACRDELALNRRTAPELYIGVVAVMRAPDGTFALDTSGDPVDWLLHMRRFDGAGLMDRLASSGQLPLPVVPSLAGAIARLHGMAEPRPDRGGLDGMRWVVEGNARGFLDDARDVLDRDATERVTAHTRVALERRARLLDERRRDGCVRVCHGDLHLGNIVLVDGRPVLFDAVEFNERISCIDVLYDVAFVLMDLWRLDLRRHANVLLNAYLDEMRSFGGLSLLPLFQSCRAAVRAKTTATASAMQTDAEHARRLAEEARAYLAHADAFLQPPPARLVAIGGRSGAGKSTLARALAPSLGAAPGAVVLRSDVVRKAMFDVAPAVALGAEAYRPDVTRRVYETLERRAGLLLQSGHSVIVDAVFDDRAARGRIADVAAGAGAPFSGVWLEAPAHVLMDRVSVRRGDASDATPHVVASQFDRDHGVIDWLSVDAARPPDDVTAAAAAALGVSGLAEHGQ